MRCRLSATGNTKISAEGIIKHNGDTIMVFIPAARTLTLGEEITVIAGGTQSGEIVVKVVSEGPAYELDASTFLTDGKLRVTSVQGIKAPSTAEGNAHGDAYDLSGRKLTDGTFKGVRIVDGRKIVGK